MSGDRYKISDQNEVYFLTLTVVDWIDVFSRKEYRYEIINAIKYCQEHKGLILYSWCLMSNHLHLVAKADEGFNMSDILRDFKKFTAKKIIKTIEEIPESRKDWLLHKFEFAGKKLRRISKYKFWKDSNHAIILDNKDIMQQKIDYIHANPVTADIVQEAQEYIFSSAKFYADEPYLIECVKL